MIVLPTLKGGALPFLQWYVNLGVNSFLDFFLYLDLYYCLPLKCIHSFKIYLLRAYSLPRTIVGIEEMI